MSGPFGPLFPPLFPSLFPGSLGARADAEFLADKFVDNVGGIHLTERERIEANLGLEAAWGTGAGCGQDPANVKGK